MPKRCRSTVPECGSNAPDRITETDLSSCHKAEECEADCRAVNFSALFCLNVEFSTNRHFERFAGGHGQAAESFQMSAGATA